MSKSGTMVGLVAAAFAVLATSEARADQCAWVDKAVAEAAAKYLAPKSDWAQFCEPCGDSKPVYRKVQSAPVVRATSSGGYWELVIDGVAVDLAYVYAVRATEDKKLGNLALLAGCPATGVSKTIPLPPAR
jgi:hypothetical protein